MNLSFILLSLLLTPSSINPIKICSLLDEDIDVPDDDLKSDYRFEYEVITRANIQFTSLVRACRFVSRESCTVLIIALDCASSSILLSFSQAHHVPLVILPTAACYQRPLLPTTASNFPKIVLGKHRWNLYKAALALGDAIAKDNTNGVEKVAVILSREYYQGLYEEFNIVAENLRNIKYVFVFQTEDLSSDAFYSYNRASIDNYIVISNKKDCQGVLHYASNGEVNMFKMQNTWIFACEDFRLSDYSFSPAAVATIFVIPEQPISEEYDEQSEIYSEILRTVSNSLEGVTSELSKTASIGCLSSEATKWANGSYIMDRVYKAFYSQTSRYHAKKFSIHKIGSKNPIGYWDSISGLNKSDNGQNNNSSFLHKVIHVVTVVENPFVFWEITPTGPRYYGYCMELLDMIAERVEFKYVVHNASEYGQLVNGEWTGAIGDVVAKRADMAVSGMIITAARQNCVDFSYQFMDYSVGIIIRKNKNVDNGFGFFAPLNLSVWVSFAALVVAVGLLMFLVTRISPSAERINELSGFTDLSKFNLQNSVWFMISSIMMQGVDIQPATLSGRIIGTIWWFFSLTVTAMYTANLAAFLTVNRMETPIDSLQNLAYQKNIKFGTVKGSPVHTDFKEQADMIPLYERIAETFKMTGDESLVTSAEAGYKRVLSGNYAFMWDDAILQWKKSIHCEYVTVGKAFLHKGYGIAISKGSDLTSEITKSILYLQEHGQLDKLKAKWFENSTECLTGNVKEKSSLNGQTGSKGIKMESVKGIFYLLIFGVLLALFATITEIWWTRNNKARCHDNSIEEIFCANEGILIGAPPTKIPFDAIESNGTSHEAHCICESFNNHKKTSCV